MNRKQNIIFIALVIFSLLTGIFVDRIWLLVTKNSTSDEAKPLYWVAPMDSSYRRNEPGKSPMGMDLVPVYADDNKSSDGAGTVRISQTVQNNLGVRIESVQKDNLTLDVDTVAYVSFDEKSLVHMHSRVDGWIEKLSVNAVGDPVKIGQKLFELYSPELVYAQEEYLSALKAGSSGLLTASTSKLKALGISDRQIADLRRDRKASQFLSFYAAQDGYVSELNAREGMYVQRATNMMSLGSLDTVWGIAEIFERQAAWVEMGQVVDMQVSAYPGEHWQGKVDYLYPVLDEKTRTLRARIVFENTDHRLKPNMFAQLSIKSGEHKDTLSVPREAVIRDGRNSRVVLALGNGKFRSVAVKTGIENGQRIEILAGIKDQDKVVTSAQFLIDSESALNAEFERMDDPESEQPPAKAHDGMHHNEPGAAHD